MWRPARCLATMGLDRVRCTSLQACYRCRSLLPPFFQHWFRFSFFFFFRIHRKCESESVHQILLSSSKHGTIRTITIYIYLHLFVKWKKEKKIVFKFSFERIFNRVRNLSCRGRYHDLADEDSPHRYRIPMKLTRPSIIRHMHGMHGNERHEENRCVPPRLTMHNSRYLCRPARNLE